MVEIDPDDFQIRVYLNDGYPTVRLILQGRKARDILKKITFKNRNKEYSRRAFLNVTEKRGLEKYV